MSKIFGLFTCFQGKKNKGEEAKRNMQDKQTSSSKNAKVLPHVTPGVESSNACGRCGDLIMDKAADDMKKLSGNAE